MIYHYLTTEKPLFDGCIGFCITTFHNAVPLHNVYVELEDEEMISILGLKFPGISAIDLTMEEAYRKYASWFIVSNTDLRLDLYTGTTYTVANPT